MTDGLDAVENDVVEDGGIKVQGCECGILSKIFGLCSSGEPSSDLAPITLNSSIDRGSPSAEEVQDKALSGEYGEGMQRIEEGMSSRQQQLDEIMKM